MCDKSEIDSIHLGYAEMRAHISTLTSMMLDVFRDTMPEETYKNLYTNYVMCLEANFAERLEYLSGIVDAAALVHYRFEVHSAISDLKRSQDFLTD